MLSSGKSACTAGVLAAISIGLVAVPAVAADLFVAGTIGEVYKGDSANGGFSQWGGICLLKGPETLVTDGNRTYVNPTGNPGLAKGGAGDALTGILAGIWSQRLNMNRKKGGEEADGGFEAAALGAYLHGFAADLAVKKWSTRGLLASDVLESLPSAFRKLGG